jgi:hypothetical protein
MVNFTHKIKVLKLAHCLFSLILFRNIRHYYFYATDVAFDIKRHTVVQSILKYVSLI